MSKVKVKADDKSVAYQLLIELLVHQFAFPVRWVETQDSLFSGQNNVSRLVELGPSKTLVGMGEKTINRKFASCERPADKTVQFLASTLDVQAICYEYEPPGEQVKEVSEETMPSRVEVSLPEPIKNVPPSFAASSAAVSIADVPLSSAEIVRTLIARKLKRSVSEISDSKSINEFCGGKSTLQNELIGDLHHEFDSLPERPEDLPVKELGEGVTSALTLGKTSAALVAKLISSKMPARFNDSSIRKHLADRWGLGANRQTAVLLFALASEPTSRLGSIKDAEQYWDDVSSRYAESCGVTLQVQMLHAAENPAVAPVVDSAALGHEVAKNKRLATKQYKALTEYLQSDSRDDSEATDIEAFVLRLQQKLDAWTAEFSEEFLAGIAPVFDAKKARKYNSWWNSVRQDVLSYYCGENLQDLSLDEISQEVFIDHVRNRANSELVMMVRALAEDASDTPTATPQLGTMSTRLQNAIILGAEEPPKARPHLPALGPRVVVTSDGNTKYTEVPRFENCSATAYMQYISQADRHGSTRNSTFVQLRSIQTQDLASNTDLTKILFNQMNIGLNSGISFENKDVLITGAGVGSIGAEIVKILLAGGARVVVTTSREPAASARYFQQMYDEHGAKGSELRLLQFNQASAQDCERLVDYIYDGKGLGIDLDSILPFAAAPEGGTELDEIGVKSEVVHRLMLVNVFRLLGRVVKNKRDRGIDSHPTQVLLPLSPNHGTFGGDGLYAESKLGLESLYNRVLSESWSEELTICGVRIGWTRSTGLMTANDIISETVEKFGVMTFTAQEMAFNIAVLLTQDIVDLCEAGPVEADYGGGLDTLENCHAVLANARRELNSAAEIAKAVKTEDEYEKGCLRNSTHGEKRFPIKPRSTLRIGFPRLPIYNQDIEPLGRWPSPRTFNNAVVVVGFSELGPWGSSRLRWEKESIGTLSQAGRVEMAWLMNLIQHFDGQRKDGYYVGWVDTKTGECVDDADIEQKYGKHLDDHTGIRLMPSKSDTGYDPLRKEFLQEIAIEEDLPEFEASTAAAEAFRLRHGNNIRIEKIDGTETCRVQVKRGATIMVAKAVPFTWGSVAGQFPTGWNAAKYGIPTELVQHLDPATLYTICCVSEAFYSAGITDPLEIFKHIHLSELGNCIGSSMGGALKTRNLYRDVYLDKEVAPDVLQDTYLNTTAAWVNMLLLGAAGPIKTPVGACATGVESIDSAYESIMAGKTKMCLVGGFDDLQEDESFGFAKMKATVNVEEERARGRLPSEMSRPMAESRAGFVESYGCGVQILCRADIALEMGLPIYGIIAGSTMSSDGIGRSVPAPGQGLLTFAKEHSFYSSSAASSSLGSDYVLTDGSTSSTTPSRFASGRDFENCSVSVSPLRAALAAWGLNIDDIDVASMHGTSTKANDTNEASVLCKQLTHLGRTAGRPLWTICQKSITGHPKAPAAAWMLNGCLQALDTGVVPGNSNADNIDPKLRENHHLCFPTRTIKTKGIKAFLLTSFGFGQKSGQVVGVAPRFLFATLTREAFEHYSEKTRRRQQLANASYVRALMSHKIVKVQQGNPYQEADAAHILLDPLSRIRDDTTTQSYRFETPDIRNASMKNDTDLSARLETLYNQARASATVPAVATGHAKAWIENRLSAGTVGIDVVDLGSFTADGNAIFLERNYTDSERKFAQQSADSHATFASRWCAKEAAFKCLQAQSKGTGAAMKEIEIFSDGGIPRVLLHGEARAAAERAGIERIEVSLSYEENCVVAVALGILAPELSIRAT